MDYATAVAERESNPLWRHFEIYRHNLWSLIKSDLRTRRRHILIATGRGGIGKSFIFQSMCRTHHIRHAMLSSDVHPNRFIRQLYDNRDVAMICYDDAGNADTAPAILEHLKAAFGPDRTVRHHIKGTKKDPPPPNEFKVSAALVWLTNKELHPGKTELHNVKVGQRRPFAAFLTRSTVLDMDDGVSDADVFNYTILLATTTPMFENAKNFISVEAKTRAINWFITNRNKLVDLTPRTLDYLGGQFEQDRKREERREEGPDMGYVLAALLSPSIKRKIPGFARLNFVDGRWIETSSQRDPQGRWVPSLVREDDLPPVDKF